jgi:hypothetical protein
MDNAQVQNNAQVPNPPQQQVPPNPPPPPPPLPAQQVNPIQPPAGQVPIVQAQVVPGANGNMDLKIQQTKLPEFGGQKEKDSISANEFVKRVDKMMSANNWSDKVAFDNFGLALKGEANTWLDSQVILKKIVGTENAGPLFGLSSKKNSRLSPTTSSSWMVLHTWLCDQQRM